MKTFLTVAVLLVASAIAAAAGANGQYHVCAKITPTPDGFLALRAAPTSSSNLIKKLRPGWTVDFDAKDTKGCETRADLSICDNGNWLHVVYTDPRIFEADKDQERFLFAGWVNTRYLRLQICQDVE